MNRTDGARLFAALVFIAVILIIIVTLFIAAGSPPTPDPSCTPTYQGDRICVAYVAETDCMCHAYSLGGLSCTPCKDLSPGVCP